MQGENWETMKPFADSILQFMVAQPELQWVHCDYDNMTASTRIVLKADEATRLGITETMLSLYLMQATQGATITTLYEESYAVPVVLYTAGINTLNADELGAIQVPTTVPGLWVPLRQVATIEPNWHHTSLVKPFICGLLISTSQSSGSLLLAAFRARTSADSLSVLMRNNHLISNNEKIIPNTPSG